MFLYSETFLKNVQGFFLYVLIIIMLALFVGPMIASGQDIENSFEVSDEMKISAEEMSCDYNKDNFVMSYLYSQFNFEYPKIVIDKDNKPNIFFIDMKGGKLVIGEIVNDIYKIKGIVNRFSELNHDSQWQQLRSREWPIVFLRGNIIHLIYLPVAKSSDKKFVYFYVYDTKIGKPYLHRKVEVTSRHINNGSLAGIYPHNDVEEMYTVVGCFKQQYLHLGTFISGSMPTFNKNFSLFLKGDELARSQRIEKKGGFSAEHISYAISQSGIGHCAWVRDSSYAGKTSRASHTVCYSLNKGEHGWTEPIEIYKKETRGPFTFGNPPGISNVSIACNEGDAYLLWEDDDEGVYFAEIQDGALIEKTKIKDIYPDSPAVSVRSMNIAVDRQGNIFILINWHHEMVLMGRVSGRWMPPIVVDQLSIYSSDMAINSNGIIHIAYIKMKAYRDFACYYRKVSPRKR